MIKKISTTLLVLSLVAPAVAVAEGDEFDVWGFVEGGVQGVDISSNNSAKFVEYRDIDDGFIGTLQLDALKDTYFFQMDAVNPGLDDQAIDVKGGSYGSFKYNLYYDEMPHNYSFNAKSFYQGLGTNRLVLPDDPELLTTTDNWTIFDYAVQHKKYGGELGFSLRSPFYVSAGVERREQEGTRPFSVRENIEVPLPVSYETDNLNLKTGYLGENISVALTGYVSSFENDNKFLLWDNLAGDPQNAVLDPDNDFSKLAADFSWRHLPLKSTLAVAGSYANLSNSFSTNDVNFDAATLPAGGVLNRTTFEGDIDYLTFSTAVVSMPLEKLDSKLYYNFVEKDNDSSRISYNLEEGDNFKELLSYDKHTAGIDLGYRLPHRTKAYAGYEYENIERSTPLPAFAENPTPPEVEVYRYDNPESTTNNTLYAKLKNNSLDWLTAQLKYKHLERDSDYTGIYDPYNNFGVIRFDAANKSMDEVKLGFEVHPLDRLDVGLDLTYQINDYDNNRETITDDERKNVYLDVAWRAYKKATISAFVGFEFTDTEANRITELQDDTVYAHLVDDNFWTYGLALHVPDVVDKLSLKFSWQYQKSDGSIKFDNSLGVIGPLVNIDESDDYVKKTFEAKAIYAFDPKLSLTVGYLFEQFDYSDIAFANYQFILPTGDFYSGAYFDQNYRANVGYVLLAYKF